MDGICTSDLTDYGAGLLRAASSFTIAIKCSPAAFLTQSAITRAPFQETAPRPSSRLRLQCVFIATDLDWTKVWGLDTTADGQVVRPPVVIRLNS
jgi:hypothetical protein